MRDIERRRPVREGDVRAGAISLDGSTSRWEICPEPGCRLRFFDDWERTRHVVVGRHHYRSTRRPQAVPS